MMSNKPRSQRCHEFSRLELRSGMAYLIKQYKTYTTCTSNHLPPRPTYNLAWIFPTVSPNAYSTRATRLLTLSISFWLAYLASIAGL